MERVTKPEKWNDSFFLKLSPSEKLIFIYLYENCNDAGFFDVNFQKISTETRIAQEEISRAFKSLEKTFLINNSSDRLWLKKFLMHQNKLPLNIKSKEGNYIKHQIESNASNFNHPKEFTDILGSAKKSRAKSQDEFIVPSLQQVIDNFKTGEWAFVPKQEIENIYRHYVSVGWKVGKTKKMADWNQAFIGCFHRNQKKHANTNQQKKSRMDVLIDENKKIENYDYSTLVRK
jgi:hypothetical protein